MKKIALLMILLVFLLNPVAGANITQDGTNSIISSAYSFPAPNQTNIDKWWAREHFLFERFYNGDGSWGHGYSDWGAASNTHPLIRYTAYAVLGYIEAYRAYGTPIYKQRAQEGLQYLLKDQIKTGKDAGAFIWYYTSNNAHIFETGLAGRALVEGYKEFNNQSYLDAANKAAAWVYKYPNDSNWNYNSFGIYFLAHHYRVTGNTTSLNNAISKAKYMLTGQNSQGYWPDPAGGGHNSIMYYHELMTRSLLELLMVMPANHINRPVISSGTYSALNYLIGRQSSSGAEYLNPTGTSLNSEEYGIEYMGEGYKNFSNMNPLLNVDYGLVGYQLKLPLTGIYDSTIPTGTAWHEDMEYVIYQAGYMANFIRYATKDTTAPTILPTERYINGSVMKIGTTKGISGVTVTTNTLVSTLTNATGFYSLAVPSGIYNLTATFEPMYYTNNSVMVSTVSSAVVMQDIELVKKPTGNITGLVKHV